MCAKGWLAVMLNCMGFQHVAAFGRLCHWAEGYSAAALVHVEQTRTALCTVPQPALLPSCTLSEAAADCRCYIW